MRSGTDHTVLPAITPYMPLPPLPRKHSPDGASHAPDSVNSDKQASKVKRYLPLHMSQTITFYSDTYFLWLDGRVARELELQSTGRGFKSRPARCECNPRQVVYTRASVTKQYNLVPANGRSYSVTGEVTAGLAESNGSLPPGLWLPSPAG